MSRKVLVTGASPDNLNNNTIMRNYVAEGFESLLGRANVRNVPLEFAHFELANFVPDLVLVFGSCMPDYCDYSLLTASCRKQSICLSFWLHDDPYEQDFNYKVVSVADLVFSNDKWATKFYDHDHCFHLPMAASRNHHYRDVKTPKDIDLFFCGVAFDNRKRLLRDIMPVLSQVNVVVLGDQWPATFSFASNRRINNAELADYVARSRLILNVGRHLQLGNDRYKLDASTPGPRTFEAAMAGAAQLYFVESLEIEEYYLPDKEILLFDSVSDLVRLFKHYLDDDEQVSIIGRAAQQRTLNDHTYECRAKYILSKFDKIR